MKFLGFDKVLCLSPHPDDVEYSMAGTIMKYKDTQFIIICMTLGTSTDETSNKKRIQEVKNFWRGTSCQNITLINPHKNCFEDVSEVEWISYIESYILKFSPQAIIGPSSLDSHQEHRFVNKMIHTFSRSKPISLIEYKSPSTIHKWIPNYLASIENFHILKIKILRSSFKSQIDSHYFSEECINAFHTDYPSLKRGIGKVEHFRIELLYET